MKSDNKLPTGICYVMPSDLRTELSKRMAPCYKGKWDLTELEEEKQRKESTRLHLQFCLLKDEEYPS